MSFAQFTEKEDAIQLLQRSLARGRLGHAYLFSGADLDHLQGGTEPVPADIPQGDRQAALVEPAACSIGLSGQTKGRAEMLKLYALRTG